MKIHRLIATIGLSVFIVGTYLPSAEAVEQPDRLTTRDRGSTSLDYHIHEIENVPHYYMQDYGEVMDNDCAITALSNMIMYWDQQYPQLVSTDDWTRVANRLVALSGFKEKGSISDSQLQPVLEEYIKEHGLSNVLKVESTHSFDYATVEKYISQDYPVLVSLNAYSYGDIHGVTGYGRHAVVIKGVVRMGSVKNVIVRSGWRAVPENAYHDWDKLIKPGVKPLPQITTISRK
ncbi:C39 family peptidase [Priestia endophytica]|uniref:Peptidase C39-like domain-containing protein n=1 Tax=Priestia endophytica TaxID=135735 RepID=A0AAX1Q7M9_9BACI|nr:C39 family peptidase [Priestia endophytica]RAS75501.1 hypothetical protein A3864_16030 [Priestia endophytica]